MSKIKITIVLLAVLLLCGNIFFIWQYFFLSRELILAESKINKQIKDQKILYFANLFIDKVLLGENVVTFEDRLKLENAVRDINDQEIFNKWQDFTNSNTDKETQKSVGVLLKDIFKKIDLKY